MAKKSHMSPAQRIIAYSAITVCILAYFCAFASSIHIVLVYHVFPLLGRLLVYTFDETFCLLDNSEEQQTSQGSSGTEGKAIIFSFAYCIYLLVTLFLHKVE